VNRAINNLLNFLGGTRPRKERDYTEEEANERTNDGRSEDDVRDIEEQVSGQDLD
jgi:hypothetical protein